MANIDITYVPNIFGRTSFPLKSSGFPLFYKKFDARDPFVVDVDNDTINIENHFFKTGERLSYETVEFENSSIKIDPSSPGSFGSINYLPKIIYPIVIDKDTIRVALASSLALSNSYVNITGVGIGSNHYLMAEKQNSKCLISIDNIIQSPLSVSSQIGITTIFPNNSLKLRVDSLKNVKPSTILKINDSLFKILTIDYSIKNTPVGYGTGYDITLFKSDSYLGTQSTTTNITGISTAYVMEGNYNIFKDKIYFTSAPIEGRTYSIKVPAKNINYNTVGISSYSFDYFTNNFVTGSQVNLFASVVPNKLKSGNNYFIIKNSENNFSFAESYLSAINNQKIEFTNTTEPVSDLQLVQILTNTETKFHGRVFLRSNYNGNLVFDDISENFNGISSTFTLKSSGISTVGIKSDNGILLVNNIFQYPEFNESFIYNEDSVSGITSITFFGSEGEYESGVGTSKDYDVNVRGLPRGGIIVGYGLSYGINYQPPISAELYVFRVLPEQEINSDNIAIGVSGSGYRSDIVYNIYFESSSGIRTTGSAIAVVENGSIVGVQFSQPGTYTGVNPPPKVVIDPSPGYENVHLTGSAFGRGASVSFDVNSSGSISNFKFTNPGYGYTFGEVLTPVGIVTSPGCIPLQITLNEVIKDTFSAWNIGRLQKLNDLTKFVDGKRKIFNLSETINGESQPISLEVIVGSQINLAYNLLVFINDVLQIPNESYTFNRGTKIIFKEAPSLGSTLKIYFYRGFENDVEFVNINPPIEPGDRLQIRKDLLNSFPQQQKSRTVKSILTSDTLKTEYYDVEGISENSSQFRSINLTPQKQDIIISGEYINKSRYSQRSILSVNVSIGNTFGTFIGVGTNIIGINTSVGIGSLINVGDYVESSYTGIGVTVSYITQNKIGIGNTYYVSSSPSGTNNIPIYIWRKIS